MDVALIVLKVIMFSLLLVAPIIIGRQITQAAKGKDARPIIVPQPDVEEAT